MNSKNPDIEAIRKEVAEHTREALANLDKIRYNAYLEGKVEGLMMAAAIINGFIIDNARILGEIQPSTRSLTNQIEAFIQEALKSKAS